MEENMKKRSIVKWKTWTARALMLSWLALAAGPGIATAAIHTVCAAGCTFNNANSNGNPVQAAIDAAVPGDIIEIRAGEVFNVRVVLPAKKGSQYITVRSSQWRDLPLPGYRVNPDEHGALMPSLQVFNTSEPALRAGANELQISNVNPATDTFTIPGHGWATNTKISCRTVESSILPDSIEVDTVYYVLNTGANTFQVSLTEGGGPLDIKSGLYSPNTYCTPVNPAHHFRFIGIDFQTKPGQETLYHLVEIGTSEESAVAGVPHHIEFERCLFRGFPNDSGPRNLLTLNGAYLRVEDSWLAHAKQYASESHAILLAHTPGPVVIRNNYINGASINILTGGTRTAIRGMVTSNVTIEGNLIEKLPYQLYGSGPGAPSGACLTGRYYINTNVNSTSCSDGGCYTCQDGSWVQDLAAPYRSSHFLTKALTEFKHCFRCRIEGNVIRTGFDGHDTGNPGYCMLLSSYQLATNRDVIFRNNRCDDVWSGFGMGSSDTVPMPHQNGPVRIENNLVTGMGRWPQYSVFAQEGTGAQRRAAYFATTYDNVSYKNNTIRTAGATTFGLLFSNTLGGPNPGFAFENNIIPQGIHVDGALDVGCGANGIGKFIQDAPGKMKNVVMFGSATSIYWSCAFQNLSLPPSVAYVSETDNRLSPTSPHSARCTSGCSFAGTDGKDVGVDVPVLEEAVSGSIAGTPKWSDQARLRVSEGSTRALLSYLAPDDVSCSVELFENAAMTQLYTDTSNTELQVDNRAGSVSDGRRRRFVLGTQVPLVANTLYYGRLTCGSRIMPFQLRTKTPGSETVQFGIQLQDSQAHHVVVEYDTNPAMTSPQVTNAVSFSNGTAKVMFPVAPGNVIYARWKKRDQSNTALASGPVEVYVAP